MAKKKENKQARDVGKASELSRLPVNKVLPVSFFVKADIVSIEGRKLNEIGELLFLPKSWSESDRNSRFIRAVELFESLAPADGAETMLAMQMVGTHSAAMECLKRAALPDQSFAGRDMALKHAQKLMALYAKQLEALNKHRGKGQQKVTVEHVHVAPGGQAIVGNVATKEQKLIEPENTIDQKAGQYFADEFPQKATKLTATRK